MRQVGDKSQFTPFGLWIREFVRSSRDGMSVTNLDYVFEDFRRKRLMLVEEKQSGGNLHHAQKLTFKILDEYLRERAPKGGYDYWGFFVVQFPRGCTMVGPGVTINGNEVTVEDLLSHLNFDKKVCEGMAL